MLKFSHSQKKDIIFNKIFSWEKIFIKSPYHKRKKDQNTIPLKIKKIPPFPIKLGCEFVSVMLK
jgi:hypothetical protein